MSEAAQFDLSTLKPLGGLPPPPPPVPPQQAGAPPAPGLFDTSTIKPLIQPAQASAPPPVQQAPIPPTPIRPNPALDAALQPPGWNDPTAYRPPAQIPSLVPPARPAPLSPAEKVFNTQIGPQSEFRRPAAPLPKTYAEESMQNLRPLPPQLVPAPPVRLSQPSTPQELAAQHPLQPATRSTVNLAQLKQQALDDAGLTNPLGSADSYINPQDSPAVSAQKRNAHTAVAQNMAEQRNAILNANSEDEVNAAVRSKAHSPVVRSTELMRQLNAAPLVRADDLSPTAKQAIGIALGQKMGMPQGLPEPVVNGIVNAVGSNLSPESMEMLYAIPGIGGMGEKAVGGYFAVQGLRGASQQLSAAREAYKRGDKAGTQEAGTEALINAVIAGAGALHLAHTAYHGTRSLISDPLSTVLPIDEGKVAEYRASQAASRAADAAAPDTIMKREGDVPRGTKASETAAEDKPILHGSNDVEELRASAERQAPKIGDAAAAAVDGVPGAKLEAVRDSKDTDRIEDKADRQGVEPNQIADIAAAKITVPDQASTQQVLENLDKTMHVESVNGSVEGEGQKNNVRQVQAIVQTGEPDEPVRRAEILIQTPEMAAAAESTHDDYRKAQELRAAGDEAGAAKLEENIKAEHDAAHEAATNRLGGGKESGKEAEEPKFKFSSTQHNIAPDSDAGVALDAVRSRIKDEDLAGDGKDIGGNHVTVRYGLKGDLTPEMRSYIEGQAPFDATLGPLEAFKPSENSDGAAPIHAPVTSPELSRINGEIGGHGEFEKSDFDDYKPHATVAYVKPEAAEQYTGDKTTAGKKFRVESIAVTDRNGGSTEIPLKGSEQTGVQAGLPGAAAESGRGTPDADRGGRPNPEPKPAELRAPAPPSAERPTPESDNLKGKQILVQDAAAGKWRPGEVKADIVNGGNNGSRTLRGVYGDGSRFDAKPNQISRYVAPDEDYRAASKDPREAAVVEKTKANLPERVAEYRNEFTKDGVLTAAVDAAKTQFPEFKDDPVGNESIVHTSAAAVAEAALNSEIADPPKPGKEVADIVTASPGSGKTTAQSGENAGHVGLRVEKIMDKESTAATLVDKLLKSGRKPAITWVYVDDPAETVRRMVARAVGDGETPGIGRSVPIDYMAESYTEMPRVLSGLMDKYGGKISVEGVDNSGDPGTARPIADLRATLDKAVKWDKKEVLKTMSDELERLHDAGVFKGERGQAIYENTRSGTESVDASEKRRAGSSPGPQGDSGKRDEGAQEAGRPEVPGPLLKEQGENEARSETRKKSIPTAQARTLRENAASHKTEVIESGGHKAIVLDPDGEAVWHRLFKNLKNADGENLLGAGTSWRGLVLDKQQANAAIAYLRAGAEDASIAAVPDKAAADGYNRLADTLKGARNAQGGVTLLRGDYRADTVREEGTHHWQREHGLDKSEAMLEVAGRPEFTETAAALREMGYEDATPRTVAMEIMAKAMAGDPELTLSDDQRESLVRSFLTEAVEEKGARILGNLPEMDPRLEKVVNEVKRGYDYDEQYDQRSEGGGRPGARVEDGSGRRTVGEEDRAGEGAGRGRQRGDVDVQQGSEEKRAPEAELAFQRGRAPKPPPSMMLPGFEEDVDAQKRSEEEEQARRLSEQMHSAKGDISRAAGEMERNSPLFRGTGDNPLLFQKDQQKTPEFRKFFEGSKITDEDGEPEGTFDPEVSNMLFQKAKGEEGPVSRKVSDLAEDLWFNRPDDKRSAIERVSEWTKDTLDESLGRSQKALGRIPTAFQKAWAWTKATSAALVHDWKHPLEQTDWKHSVGDMQLAEAETAQRLQGLAKELKKSAPKETDRIAMTHYMEAAGNQGRLREWAAGSKAKAMQAMNDPLMSRERKQYLQEAPQHYERALNLTPEQKELAQKFRDHFDDMLELAKQNGLLEYGYRNYVMHLFEKADAANLLHEVDTNDLNPNPGFIKRRFYDTFFSAEQNGMTAKSKDIAYLLTAYDKSMNEAIASRNFMRGLLDAKAPDGRPIAAIKMRGGWLIAKEGQEPQVMKQRQRPESLEGYRDFDRPQLRNFLFKPTTEDLAGYDPRLFDEDPDKLAFRGDLIIHPKYASQVEDMLTPGWFERGEGAAQKTGRFIAKASGAAKELMTVAAPFHMVQEGIHSIEHKVNPFNLKDIDLSGKSEDSRKQRLLASRGLTLTNYDAEGLFATKALRGIFEAVPGINKAMDTLHSFSRWQFEDFIPKLKMQMALEAFDRNTERYDGKLSKDQIAELTAKESNAAFGNLNSMFDSVPRTKTFKAILRLALFAPDFLESRMRFVGQSFTRYGGEQRAALIRGALVQYAVARVANALLNDGDAKWDPQHAFSIVYHGKAYQLRTVQGDLLHAVIDPNGFIYNRLNPLTTRPAIEFISGRDQMGREKAFGSQVKDLAKATLPFGIQKRIQTPDEDWLNSILTSTGFEAKNDRTPTEQEVHKLYLKHIPDSNQSEEKQAESRKMRSMEDAVRQGKMAPADVWAEVQKGAITPKEAARTVERAQKSRLALEFQSLSLPDAMDVYASVQKEANHPLAFPHAHLDLAELKPEMQKKRALVEELPQADRQSTAEKLNDMLAENEP